MRPSSTDQYEQIQSILNDIVLPIITVCGILGNSLILVILTRYRMCKTVTSSEVVVHTGLLAMAISDLLFNISVLPRAFVPEGIYLPASSFDLFYNLYSTGFITTFSLTSTWLIVVTSGLRYFGVCHPLRARYLIRRTSIYTIIGFIVLVCIIGNIPQFFIQKPVPFGKMVLIDNGPFSHEHLRGVIYSWIRAAFSIFIPGLLLIYFNIRLMLSLQASRRLHRMHVRQSVDTSRHKKGASNRLTRTLIAVIIMFIVLVYPSELIDFFTHIAPLIDIKDNISVMIGRTITNLIQVSNFSFNFILYCIMNTPFRKAFQDILCRCSSDNTRVNRLNNESSCCCNIMVSARPQEFQRISMTTSTKTRSDKLSFGNSRI